MGLIEVNLFHENFLYYLIALTRIGKRVKNENIRVFSHEIMAVFFLKKDFLPCDQCLFLDNVAQLD